jgi:hypothetical protein
MPEERRMLLPGKKKSTRAEGPPQPVDPQTLRDAQSVKRAVVAAMAVTLVLSGFWMFFASVTGRVFPWFSVIQGIFIGLAVRRFGRGLDWRFPLVAGLFAWAGAFFGNLVVAIPATTSALDASWWEVIRGLTWWSLRTFFDEVITVVDYIYAFFAAAVAVFYAKRRLNRHEVFALRTRQHS